VIEPELTLLAVTQTAVPLRILDCVSLVAWGTIVTPVAAPESATAQVLCPERTAGCEAAMPLIVPETTTGETCA
jgi:hypothetical protein